MSAQWARVSEAIRATVRVAAAYAATVTRHDAEGESIHTIRYGRMPKADVRGLCRGLARDVTARGSRQDFETPLRLRDE